MKMYFTNSFCHDTCDPVFTYTVLQFDFVNSDLISYVMILHINAFDSIMKLMILHHFNS